MEDDQEDLVPPSEVEELVARLASHPLRSSFEDDDADLDTISVDSGLTIVEDAPTPLRAVSPVAAASKVTVRRDFVYYKGGPDAHREKHRLNVFSPDTAAPGSRLPCVIHVHGGGWQRGDRNAVFYGAPYMAEGYAANGFVAIAPSYRLAGLARFPAQAIDCARVIRWVVDNADELGVDASRVFLSGHSAGGHLVSLLALHDSFLRDVGLEPTVICGVVTISGIYSLSSPMTMPEQSPCSIKTAFFHRVYVRPTFGADQALWKAASPIEHLTTTKRRVSPFLVVNAQIDLGLQYGAQTFVDALKQKGVSVSHHVVPKTTHATVTRHATTLALASDFFRGLWEQ
eukprot:TRINITY_DN2341_c0_g1_i1.p1 TRINITY_DN2341_c0_g1~~TRINITY_DN2341_c0_g1_i1.p1  ORF type:complete len:366 (+),score=99.11 TRINITY_DN2341_c0_g1_i1:72-1100(+)